MTAAGESGTALDAAEGKVQQPNHGEGPGRRKRKCELDKLMEDKKVSF